MKEIIVHGSLEKFGKSFKLDVRDPAEAVRALTTQIPGFREAIVADNWHVIRGSLEDGESVDEEGLARALGKTNEIHIMPAVEGAGGDGVGKVLAGVALVAASFVPGLNVMVAGALFSMGTSMALGGVSMMLTNQPSSNYNQRERPEERPSFMFDGPVNTSTQGLPVPVVYGRIRTGSIVVSAGITAEELAID